MAADLGDVAVLMPARNEAEYISQTLSALSAQGRGLAIVVVDDESSDGTSGIVESQNIPGLELLKGSPLPDGWSGKVWALQQGLARIRRPLVALVDADVALGPGVLSALKSHLLDRRLGLISVMVEPNRRGFWARLLMPAFVFFFKLLYPFRLANVRDSRVAAAAGGCVLLRADAIDAIGGFASIRGELIDDCALARQVKRQGFGTWIGLTRRARSLRSSEKLPDVWRMVARTAFTQLRYSLGWLFLCTLLMAIAFAAPVAGLLAGTGWDRALAAISCACMAGSYLPVLCYYEQSPLWVLAMPFIGCLYLLMTWSSALRHWQGEGSCWRGRVYAGDRHRCIE
jgi:hopene-associated glycosyltransferase HpnB